jgi:hypothetical protein
VEEVMAREDRSFELPAFSYQMDDTIKRVVVRTVDHQLTVESTDEKAVSLFGTYRVQTSKKAKLLENADDVVSANQKGDTLYLNMKSLPNEIGLFNVNGETTATLLIPNNVKLEVVGNDNSLTLKPRSLVNDWNIESVSTVVVDVAANSNLKVDAVGAQEVRGKDGDWKVSLEKTADGMDNGRKNAVYQSGAGKYHINMANVYEISLNTNQ